MSNMKVKVGSRFSIIVVARNGHHVVAAPFEKELMSNMKVKELFKKNYIYK